MAKGPNQTKKRDYRAEYLRRIELGTKRGLTKSQAAGKPKKNEFSATLQLAVRLNKNQFKKQTRKMSADGNGYNSGIFRLFLDANELAGLTGNTEIVELFNAAMRDGFKRDKANPRPFDKFLNLRRELIGQSDFEAGPGNGES